MRKNIFELLDGKINYYNEICSIEMILKRQVPIEDFERIFGEPKQRTIANIVNKSFLQWEYRGTSNSLSDLESRIDVLKFTNGTMTNPTMKDFLLYCEAVYNACDNAYYQNEYRNAQEPLRAIMSNIEISLSKIGYKIYTYPNEIKSIAIINNEKAVAAASISDELYAIKIMEYNSHLLIGDINSKKIILKTLSDLFEKNRQKLKSNGFTSIESNIGFLLNNLNIRHNNEKDDKSSKFIKDLSKKKLEKWYDKTYNLIITSIMDLESVEINKEILELKSKTLGDKEKKNGKDEDAE